MYDQLVRAILGKCSITPGTTVLVLALVLVLNPGHDQLVNDFGQEHDYDLGQNQDQG